MTYGGAMSISGSVKTLFLIVRERAIDYLNICDRLYITDGFAGWDPKYRIKVRVVASRPYYDFFYAQYAHPA